MEKISAFGRSFTMPELTTPQKVPDGFCNEQAGACKKTVDPSEGQKLLDMIDDIAKVFAETKQG